MIKDFPKKSDFVTENGEVTATAWIFLLRVRNVNDRNEYKVWFATLTSYQEINTC